MNIVWKIEWMKCIPELDGFNDYVIECGWRCDASEGNHAVSNYGSCGFAAAPSSNAIPYPNLTESQVLGWVWQNIDKADIEASLTKQINRLVNPTVVQPPLPW